MPRPFFLAVALYALALLTLSPAADAQGGRERLDIDLFTRVPNPGQPEPIAVGPKDGLVYVGTNQLGHGDTDAPSKVFVYTPEGRFVRDYTVRGQDLGAEHGIQGLAFDGDGLLYLLDRAARPRVIVLDPGTGEQRDYATFRDVPSCRDSGRTSECSRTGGDEPAAPDYAVFSPDGAFYVTDIEQALIWRVPRGGGRAELWFTDARLESPFGPNGIQFMADERTLLFAMTVDARNSFAGFLYRLPVRPDGRPGELERFWQSRPFDAPDGFAIARSGNLYLALAAANQIALISPRGQELARAPSPAENLLLEVPVDGPGSAAFLGERVLVTNHSAVLGSPRSWAVLDVFAGEPGLPLHYPVIARASRPAQDRQPDGDAEPGGDEPSDDERPAASGGDAAGAAGESGDSGDEGRLPLTGLPLAGLIVLGALMATVGVLVRPPAGRR